MEALGGPTTYSQQYGDETSVVRMHSGNGEHEEMDRRAIACFDQAMADTGLSGNDQLRQVLHDYFSWATTTTMSRYHRSADDVPNGLRIPHWSWGGLADLD
jgi:hemoglobin